VSTMTRVFLIVSILVLPVSSATRAADVTVYERLGGQEKIQEIVDNFITEIEFDEIMYGYFKESDIDRFREKFAEHLCLLSGGGCEYTGDSMEDVHAGMNLTEGDFNHGVDLFIKAMDKADIPHPVQNRLLATMVPTRKEMLYK